MLCKDCLSDCTLPPPRDASTVTSSAPRFLEVEVRVYATRLLFYLIADDAVRTVLNGVAPAAAVVRRDAPPATEDLFVTSGAASAAPFTLEGVMRSAEHCGGPEDPQPAGVALAMKPYQLQALRWMRSMERLDRGLTRVGLVRGRVGVRRTGWPTGLGLAAGVGLGGCFHGPCSAFGSRPM